MYYFYIIQSVKKPTEIYTGSTNDLKDRILQHNQGKVSSTKRYIPWRLVYYEAYLSEKDTRIREQKFKRHGKSNIELKKRLRYSLSLTFPEEKVRNLGNYKNQKKGEGFTLIELIIYIAVVTVVLALASGFAWNIIQGNIKAASYREVQQNARFAMEKITRALRAGEEPTALFHFPGGILYQGIVPITTDQVRVTKLRFTPIVDTYQINLTVKYNNPSNRNEYDASVNLKTTVSPRQ